MAVKVIWSVRHNCGHEEEHDLSGKRAFRRASYARWLARRDCSSCRWTRRNVMAAEDVGRGQVEFQPDEMAEIAERASRGSTPARLGTKLAVDRAHWVRRLLLGGGVCNEAAPASAAKPIQAVEPTGRTLSLADWWASQDDAGTFDEPVGDGSPAPAGDGGEAC